MLSQDFSEPPLPKFSLLQVHGLSDPIRIEIEPLARLEVQTMFFVTGLWEQPDGKSFGLQEGRVALQGDAHWSGMTRANVLEAAAGHIQNPVDQGEILGERGVHQKFFIQLFGQLGWRGRTVRRTVKRLFQQR